MINNNNNVLITHYQDLNKRTNKENPQKLYLRIKQGSLLNIKSIDSKLKILPSAFKENINMMNINNKEIQYLNNLIAGIRQYINSLNNREHLTKVEITNWVNSFYVTYNNLSLTTLLNDYFNKRKKTLTNKTTTPYNSFIEFLKSTLRSNASITILNNDLIEEFEKFLLDNITEATAKTYIEELKRFINKFIEANDYDIKQITYKTISKRNSNKDFSGVYLTNDELLILREHLATCNNRDKRIIYTLFLGIITALRYSDLIVLQHVVNSDNKILHENEIIDIKTAEEGEAIYSKKTRKLIQIGNNKFIKFFFENYEILSHKYYNKELKRILKELNFNRIIIQHEGTRNNKRVTKVPLYSVASSHIMRRTAITNCYLNTKDIYLAMQLANHSDLGTTVKYLKLTDLDNFKLKNDYTEKVIAILTDNITKTSSN